MPRPRTRALIVPLLVALATLTGCDLSALWPTDLREFTPPAVYQQWWATTQACAQRDRSIRTVRWYVSTGDQLRSPSGDEAGGYYSPGQGRIVLARAVMLDGSVVRHEMLHALLHGTTGHPRAQFREQCAGTVLCIEECTTDGGPLPPTDPATPLDSPSTLTVRVSSTQDTVSRSDSTSIYSVTIAVTNPATTTIIADLPPSPDAGPPVTFDWSMSTRDGSCGLARVERFDGASSVRFAAGETKRFVVDIEASELCAGDHDFVGGYGNRNAASPARVHVRP